MEKIKLLCLIAICSCLVDCNYSHAKSQEVSQSTPENLTSFDGLLSSVFEPKCAHCHSGATPAGQIDLTTYAAIVNSRGLRAGSPENSLIYTEVASGDMPDGGPALGPSEVAAISKWITAGAPNGAF